MRQILYATVVAVVAAFIVAAIAYASSMRWCSVWLDRITLVSPANRATLHERARHLKRAVTLLAYTLAAVASLSLALARLGLGSPGLGPRTSGPLAGRPRFQCRRHRNRALRDRARAANFVVEHLQLKLASPFTHPEISNISAVRRRSGAWSPMSSRRSSSSLLS